MDTFGRRLRARREAIKLTQEALALELGMSKAAVSRWESDVGLPTTEVLPRLRELLGVSLDHLVCGDPSERRGAPGVAEARAGYGLTAADRDLLQAARSLSERKRAAILRLIADL